MANEVITIPRVYLKQKHFHKSAYHTAYAPAPSDPHAQPGVDQALVTLTFEMGIARNVPKNLYDLFEAMGIATTNRPKRPWEIEEEEERERMQR